MVQVHAAGVNLVDSKVRNGEFKFIVPHRLPIILGHAVAGAPAGRADRSQLF